MTKTRLKTAKEGMTRIYRPDGTVIGVTVLSVNDDELTKFSVGQAVIVQGRGKGKGFSGTIRRHNFARGPVSHGSHNIRKPGSVGAMYPQHVQKGQKMPGRHGGGSIRQRSFVEAVLAEKKLLLIRGAVPGSRRSVVYLEKVESKE